MTDKAVQFPDQNLELEIRKLLDNYSKPIYQSQLLGFIELDLSGKRISDISGLEKFRHLEVLNLENNFVKDLSPLKSLNNLHVLNTNNNGITDLDETQFDLLTHIPLVELYLNSTEILSSDGQRNRLSDIDLLGNFHQMEVLELHGNQVKDLSALSDLTKLRELDLGENQIQDISPLKNLRLLETLDLRRNEIIDISALSDLKELLKLNLRDNKINDITPLRSLDQLNYLNIHSNVEIQSIAPLANLTKLSELILENVPVKDQVWVFEKLVELNRLNVANCQISDFSVLGSLMESGVLQDDPTTDIEATLNIRDNILQDTQEDPLGDLRPHWENISHRDPFVLPTMPEMVSLPQFSQDGGYFKEELELMLNVDIPTLEIYYTLDGSDPDPKRLGSPQSPYQITYKYSEPINIVNRKYDENIYSAIRTTHVENEIPWKPPKGNVYKAQTIRAIAYDPQRDIKSKIVTNTYFVDENIFQRYPDLPVISLTADYDVLFDSKTGILNTGLNDNPFYHLETKVPANIQLFEPDGSIGFNGLYEIKLHGFTSVANPQKSFHVYAEPWLGDETINYPIFQNAQSKASKLKTVDRFILRAWGTALEWDVFFSDAYHQTLMAGSDLDIQGYQPAILFINGEYWGLYEIREANKNLAYFEGHYFQNDPVDLDILELGTIDFIEAGDANHWKDLLAFIEMNDIKLAENYAYVKTKVDVENFIQYMIHCIYTGKKDWPGHNEAIWRPRTKDGKWHWIQFDMDQGLRFGVDNHYDMVGHVLKDGAIPHPLLVVLMENEEFRLDFINTFAHMMNTYFRTSVEMTHFAQMAEELEPYIPEYIDRWYPDMEWQKSKNLAFKVIEERWVLRKNQVLDNFYLNGTSQIHISTNQLQGNIAINGFLISEQTPGISNPADWIGTYFNDIPITFSAVPNPGFQFVRWESSLGTNHFDKEFTVVLDADMKIKAIFKPID